MFCPACRHSRFLWTYEKEPKATDIQMYLALCTRTYIWDKTDRENIPYTKTKISIWTHTLSFAFAKRQGNANFSYLSPKSMEKKGITKSKGISWQKDRRNLKNRLRKEGQVHIYVYIYTPEYGCDADKHDNHIPKVLSHEVVSKLHQRPLLRWHCWNHMPKERLKAGMGQKPRHRGSKTLKVYTCTKTRNKLQLLY